jgi:hypothetical protein
VRKVCASEMRVANNADFHMFRRILARNSQNSYFHLSGLKTARAVGLDFIRNGSTQLRPSPDIEATDKTVLLAFFEEHRLR